jgi:hypothetical protein
LGELANSALFCRSLLGLRLWIVRNHPACRRFGPLILRIEPIGALVEFHCQLSQRAADIARIFTSEVAAAGGADAKARGLVRRRLRQAVRSSRIRAALLRLRERCALF